MTGKELVLRVLAGEPAEELPVLPIAHTALARVAGVPLGRYFTDPDAMAAVMVDGFRRFRLDGVQLSLGVTGEAEALGARVEQPADASPLLREHLLADPARLDSLRGRDAAAGGRMPLYHEALRKVVQEIGGEAFVISTLRGPLNIASQLRGVEELLIDMVERPAEVARVLEFATDVALQVSRASLEAGADGILFGEATASPNFISPAFYRTQVQPHHARLLAGVIAMGWRAAGLHVCGDIRPILGDLISAGATFLDVDYQVPAAEAVRLSGGRVALRGNIDPASVLFLGDREKVRAAARALAGAVRGTRWIAGTGCDIPPGTRAENIHALVEAFRSPQETR